METMLTIIKNADIYAPKHIGIKDILLAGGKIAAIEDKIDISLKCKVIDAEGEKVIPGLIDGHVHLIGGGGEDGCLSRVPALKETKLAEAGVTSVVGLLGTDGQTRTIRDLLAKTKALREWGVSAWCLTGSYQLPSPTITGNVGDDILFIDEIIGVKVAISDHRCSLPTLQELIRLACDARLASLMAKKCGIVHIHVGADKRGIEDLFTIADTTPLPLKHFYPTHMGGHLDQAEKWLERGGHVDITCSGNTREAIERLIAVNKENLTLSTDSNGSFPKWNDKREIIGMGKGSILALYESIKELINAGIPREDVYALATSNAAKALKLTGKGEIAAGCDADLCILNGEAIDKVIAKGEIIKDGTYIKSAMYEDD